MSERLDRIEQSLDRLIDAVNITNQSVQSLRSEIAQGFTESREYTDSSFGAMVEAMDQRDTEVRAQQDRTDTMLQNLIGDGRADRAETQRQRLNNEREHQEFRRWMQAIQENIQSLLGEIRDIWQRLNSA